MRIMPGNASIKASCVVNGLNMLKKCQAMVRLYLLYIFMSRPVQCVFGGDVPGLN